MIHEIDSLILAFRSSFFLDSLFAHRFLALGLVHMFTIFLSNFNFSASQQSPSTSSLHHSFAKCFYHSKDKLLQTSDLSCTKVGILTNIYYLHFCIFNLSLPSLILLHFALARHLFSARYYLISATVPTSLLNFISALQVNIAFTLARTYMSPVSLVSLSICSHPICPADFTNNQLIFFLGLASWLSWEVSFAYVNHRTTSFRVFYSISIPPKLQLQNCQLQSSLSTFITFRPSFITQILLLNFAILLHNLTPNRSSSWSHPKTARTYGIELEWCPLIWRHKKLN